MKQVRCPRSCQVRGHDRATSLPRDSPRGGSPADSVVAATSVAARLRASREDGFGNVDGSRLDGREGVAAGCLRRGCGQQHVVDEEVLRGAHGAAELQRRQQLQEQALRCRLRQLALQQRAAGLAWRLDEGQD